MANVDDNKLFLKEYYRLYTAPQPSSLANAFWLRHRLIRSDRYFRNSSAELPNFSEQFVLMLVSGE